MLNQCNFIGRLGADPETKYTQAGTSVSNFSIACTETWKKQDGSKDEKTEWVRIVAFGKLAEVCGEYLSKGSLVFISGKMQTRKWQDRDGNDRYTTEIIAREMKMLSGRNDGAGSSQQGGGESPWQPTGDDVPF